LLQSVAQLRRLVTQAKEKGSVTIDQLNQAMPGDFPPEQFDELIAMLEARGIGVVRGDVMGEPENGQARTESTEQPEAAEPAAAEEQEEQEETTSSADEELGRTDDPVRM